MNNAIIAATSRARAFERAGTLTRPEAQVAGPPLARAGRPRPGPGSAMAAGQAGRAAITTTRRVTEIERRDSIPIEG